METPEVTKSKGISPIWILPIVALLIGGWLLYKSVNEAGIDIIVHFSVSNLTSMSYSESIFFFT